MIDGTGVAHAVASALGLLVDPVAGSMRAIENQLGDRRMLLCLDNCEHLLEACRDLATRVMTLTRGVSILATSREPLGIPSEVIWRVPPLTPDDAETLLLERARQVRPWLTLDEAGAAAVTTIGRRLDGIPLALELAAAWFGALTPVQIAARLDERLTLLVRGSRGAVPRQQTLAASITWSYDLLDERDRVVLRRLAVFAGGFTLDAASAVCAGAQLDGSAVLESIGRLTDASLVTLTDYEGMGRYRLLESIQQFAMERLVDAEEVAATRDRHLDHFVEFAQEAGHGLIHVDQDEWLPRLARERENARAALDFGRSLADPERFRRLAAEMVWVWYLGAHTVEGLAYLDDAVASVPNARTALQAQLLVGVAGVAVAAGQFHRIAESASTALTIAREAGDELQTARALFLLGTALSFVDFDASWATCGEALDHAAVVDDPFVEGGATVLRGTVLSHRDRYDEARPLLQQGYETCMRRNQRYFAGMALNYLDDEAIRTGRIDDAVELATRAVDTARPVGDFYSMGQATTHLALAVAYRGDLEEALRLVNPIVRSLEDAGPASYVPRLGAVLGTIHLRRGDLEQAVRWFEIDVQVADPMSPSLVVVRSLPGLADALRRLGRHEEALERVDQGEAMAEYLGMGHAQAAAIEQRAFLVEADDPARALDLHHQALALRVQHGLCTFAVDSLDALAVLSAARDQAADAARLLGASDTARDGMGYPRAPVDAPDLERLEASLGADLGADGLDHARAEGRGLTLDEAVALATRARGARGRPAAGWASLTPTEVEVARLVVEGLTNPQIGERLFIGRGTVKTHLSHIYTKLGITGRSELAAIAVTRLDAP